VKNDPAPIVLFVYNRPWHAEQTLNALMQNELAAESILYIFADGPKNNVSSEQLNKITEVRQIIRSKQWCKEVIIVESEENKGLANSIITGVTEVINKHEKVIVLEDDLVTSKFFLRFMNESLLFYKENYRIFSIGGVNYTFPISPEYKDDIYIVHRTESCGWGTWSDRWMKADWNKTDYSSVFFDKKEIKKFNRGGDDLIRLLQLQIEGKIDSWAIRWDYCHYQHDAYCLRPVKSFVRNIGFDGSGVHSDQVNGELYSGIQYDESIYKLKLVRNIVSDKMVEKNFKFFFDGNSNCFKRVTNKTMRLIRRAVRKIKVKRYYLSLNNIAPVSSTFGFDRGTPIDRLYIEHFLMNRNVDIKGKVLEVAESTYTKKFGINVDVSQILHFDKSNSQATIVGDLSAPQDLPEGVADCFICTQTLNFIFDVQSAIIGCYKLLSDGGVFLGTVAGLSQISRYDMDRWGDHWRFTDLSIKKMFEEVFGEGHVEVHVYGNALAATAFIQGLAVEEMPSVKKLMQVDENYQLIIGIKAIKKG